MKIYKYFISLLFCSALIFLGVKTIFTKPLLESQVENRLLSQCPTYNYNNLITGNLFAEFDTYFKDQIWCRSSWIKYCTKIQLLMGKKKYLDVIIGNDGYLLPFNSFYSNISKATINSDIDYVCKEICDLNKYINNLGCKFIFVGVPSQSYINKDKYPKLLYNKADILKSIEDRFFYNLNKDKINNINMTPIFEKQNIDLYFKTDHHYNFEGTYLTYEKTVNLLKDIGINIYSPLTKTEINPTKVNKPFMGSWNAKLNFLYTNDDFISLPAMKFPNYKKIVNGKEDNRLFYYNDSDPTINYASYMNGNNAEIIITTKRNKFPNALIIGDSFTHGVEPLLFTHFNETRMLDLRYFKYETLYEYIKTYNPDIVIYVGSNDTYIDKGDINKFK